MIRVSPYKGIWFGFGIAVTVGHNFMGTRMTLNRRITTDFILRCRIYQLKIWMMQNVISES